MTATVASLTILVASVIARRNGIDTEHVRQFCQGLGFRVQGFGGIAGYAGMERKLLASVLCMGLGPTECLAGNGGLDFRHYC